MINILIVVILLIIIISVSLIIITTSKTSKKPIKPSYTTHYPTTHKGLTTHYPTTHRGLTTHGPTTNRPTTNRPTTNRPTTNRPTTHGPTTHGTITTKPVFGCNTPIKNWVDRTIIEYSPNRSGLTNSEYLSDDEVIEYFRTLVKTYSLSSQYYDNYTNPEIEFDNRNNQNVFIYSPVPGSYFSNIVVRDIGGYYMYNAKGNFLRYTCAYLYLAENLSGIKFNYVCGSSSKIFSIMGTKGRDYTTTDNTNLTNFKITSASSDPNRSVFIVIGG